MNSNGQSILLGIIAVLVVACLYMHTKAQDALSRVESLERTCNALQQSMDSLVKLSEVTTNQLLEWKVSLDNVDTKITEQKKAARESIGASKPAAEWADTLVPADVLRVLKAGDSKGTAARSASALP